MRKAEGHRIRTITKDEPKGDMPLNTHRQGKLKNPARHPSDTEKTVLPRRYALLPGTSLSACAGA